MRSVLIALWLLVVLCTAPAQGVSPFEALYDLDNLPLLQPGVRMLQVSSHDPTGGNGDAGHYVRTEGNVKVLADLQGPGIVRRIWSANPSGRLQIFVDGATKPVVDTPFTDLFQDKLGGFRPPLAGTSSGGWYAYVPVPFEQSCRITAVDSGHFYYQVTWEKRPAANGLKSFTGQWGADDMAASDRAVRAWTNLGEYPKSSSAVNLPLRSVRLDPLGRWSQPVIGPGTITAMHFQFPQGITFKELRQVILRITFDGSTVPQVEAPLGDFFGVGFDGVRWKSLALGADGKGFYCYFRMPFKSKANIQLENTGSAPVRVAFHGSARPGTPAMPWGYFRASYRNAINQAGQEYEMARLRGRGHIVGVTHSMRGIGSQWFLEGDEKIYVDGEQEPGIYGTGTEDYYNCGWYFNTGLVSVATHGLGHKNDNEIMAYRMHIPDPIHFERELDFWIEHGGGNDVPGSEYSSVCYWYGANGAVDNKPPLPRGAALLPKPYLPPTPGGVEVENLEWETASGATARKQPWHDISKYRGGGRVVLQGLESGLMSTPFDIRFTDYYEIDLILSGANTDSSARLLIDGNPEGPLLRDGAGPLPTHTVNMGRVMLREGRHTLGLELQSGTKMAIDAFKLTPVSPLVRDFAVLGSFPVDPATGVNTSLAPDGEVPALGVTFRTPDNRPVSWKVMRAPNGVLDITNEFVPNKNAVAYASFAVKSPEDRNAVLMTGSDDGIKVFVNGDPVFTKRAFRGLRTDEDRIPIVLKKGWNTVVLKVDQAEVLWAVTARLVNPEGDLELSAMVPTGE